MANQPPPIDARTAIVITQQVETLLKTYTQEFGLDLDQPDPIRKTLVGVFARFSELIIQRLNQVPQKNFLAFLNLLGASRLPPQPARVPLTFFLAAGSAADGIVPAGTQVAAPPVEGETEPVLFETERELVVTAAKLESVFVRNPQLDQYGDYSALANLTDGTAALVAPPEVSAFKGNLPIQHIFYLGHSRLLGFENGTLSLRFTLAQVLGDGAELEWQFWQGQDWKTIFNQSDAFKNLAQTVANPPNTVTINLGAITPIPLNSVNGQENRWLRGRLKTPITPSDRVLRGMVRQSQLVKISKIELIMALNRPVNPGLLPEAAFSNGTPIDLNKDFFPFGEKPKFNDTLYLANQEAFSKDRFLSDDRQQSLATRGATVQLDVTIANPHWLATPSSVRPSEDLQLVWESWNGTIWQAVGTTSPPTWLSLLEVDPLPSATTSPIVVQGTLRRGATLTITPDPVLAGAGVNLTIGEEGRFAAQVPIAQGLTVITFTARLREQTAKAYAVVVLGTDNTPPTLTIANPQGRPLDPITNQAQIQLLVDTSDRAATVQTIRITNGRLPSPDLPNIPATVSGPKGTVLPAIGLAIGRNELLIEGLVGERRVAATTVTLSREAPRTPDVDRQGFSDGTYGLCQSGIVQFRLPDSVRPIAVNGQENDWIRVRLLRGDYGKDATYRLLNPLNPSAGFTLSLATFRPPAIGQVRIGYTHTLTGGPELCLADNYQTFRAAEIAADASVTNDDGEPFQPFQATPELRPSLYLGLTLPANRSTFPNRPLSLFCRTADLNYGERSVPLSPTQSLKEGRISSVVRHVFVITNTKPQQVDFTATILGTTWETTLQVSASDDDGLQVAEVQVQLPDQPNLRDRGFLKLTMIQPPYLEAVASFETVTTTEAIPDQVVAETVARDRLQLDWQYWNGERWSKLTVQDNTENFTRSGTLEFLPPADFSLQSRSVAEFGRVDRYWLKVEWQRGQYDLEPKLRRLLLNTTMAVQAVTVREEVLGSSDGSANQKFRTIRHPVLQRQQLQVREPELPAEAEQIAIQQQEGADAIAITHDAAGRPQEIWVRWHEVSDFYASGARDRHYLLDHLTGEIQFGDGLNGLVPPIGTGNLRLVQYRTGGGMTGNRAAGTIVQLKTTVPYVEKVTNLEPATGGADAESLDSLIEREPRTLRHRSRAVALSDYEDLAKLASPEVERAKCVPLRDLSRITDSLEPLSDTPGTVSLIIVPRSRGLKPSPSLELVNLVQTALRTQGSSTAQIVVVGPQYVRVSVTAEVALKSLQGASTVEQAVYAKLDSFLHPLTGGLDGTGWDFGREPHQSDFYQQIESVPGVDHIRNLILDDGSDNPTVQAIKQTGLFLVYSGQHTIRLVFTD